MNEIENKLVVAERWWETGKMGEEEWYRLVGME